MTATVEELKPKTVSKLKKKKKKLTQAKKAVKAPATPARQVIKPEEMKEVEVPEPVYEAIAFPEIGEETTKEDREEILAKYGTKVQDNQRKFNAAVKNWVIHKTALERPGAHGSDL